MLQKLNKTTAGISPSASLPVKVVQFGEGNFLRAFADWIIDIMNEQNLFGGKIAIVQPLPAGMVDVLDDQEGLYHVVLNGIEDGQTKKEIRLITSVETVVNPYKDFTGFLALAENPHLEFILSNTTESGIVFNPDDTHWDQPGTSFPAKLTSLLYQRFRIFKGHADKGVIFLPCELIERNGEILKQTILQYIQHWKLEPAFHQWIDETCSFCNTLVDRIVPGFPKDNIDALRQEIGYDDKLVVMAELFHLWVIEAPAAVRNKFPADKANLHVKFVDDLTPYRTRKVRILNGAHTAMVPFAYLKGTRTVQQAIEDPETFAFAHKVVFEEIIPTLDLDESELISFANSVLERFKNPFIRHELSSIALNSISKFKVRVLPSLLQFYQQKGKLPQGLTESLANLIAFYKGEWRDEKLPVNDAADITTFFDEQWKSNDPVKVTKAVLSHSGFWGQDLTEIPGLEKQVSTLLNELIASGVAISNSNGQ
jgi:tagaturonate reductase